MNKMNKTDINNLGKVLYGTAITLTATATTNEHRFIAAAVFILSIMMILLTMETQSPADYINGLFYALGVGGIASAIVQLLSGNILAFSLLLLAGIGFMYLYRFLDKYFTH